MRTVQAQPLSPESFAPYGRVIAGLGEPTLARSDIDYWHDVADLTGLGNDGIIGYLIAHRREFVLESIERHNHCAELFVPVDGITLFPVAPPSPGEGPDLSRLAVFILEPGQAVLLHTGTWHWAPFPVSERAAFVLALRRSTVPDDVEVVPIEQVAIGMWD